MQLCRRSFKIALVSALLVGCLGSRSGFGQTATTPHVVARIEKTIDSKSAKAGDEVIAKTLGGVHLPDKTFLPKGTKLIAKVSEAQSKRAGNGNSTLMFRFDQAEIKGGNIISIKGQVVAVGPSLAADSGMGQGSVVTPGLAPNADAALGRAGAQDEYNIADGSTLPGVVLELPEDADWKTDLSGFKKDILLDSDVLIKVQMKR